MTKYTFYVTTSQSGGEGQGNTHTDAGTDVQTKLIRHTERPTETETTYPIGLIFIRIRIQLEF